MQITLGHQQTLIFKILPPENNIPTISNIETEWEIEDSQLPEKETSSVISTDSAHWSVEPSMTSSLPVFEDHGTDIIDTPFGIEDAPVPPSDIIENKHENPLRENFRPTTTWGHIFLRFSDPEKIIIIFSAIIFSKSKSKF